MKTKKILVRFFIVCMVVMSFTTTAFANIVDDLKKEPNAMALVTIDNEDCTEIANLKDLSVRITAPGTNINIIIPVEEVKEDGETLGALAGLSQRPDQRCHYEGTGGSAGEYRFGHL